MEPRWYEQAMESLERELDEGTLSKAEFRQAVRELNAELREAAYELAERARDEYYDRR